MVGVLASRVSIQQRVHEFGALGATTSDVLRLVVGDAGRVVAAGAAIGLVLSPSLAASSPRCFFAVTPLDLVTFAMPAVVLTVISATAIAGRPGRHAGLSGHRAAGNVKVRP